MDSAFKGRNWNYSCVPGPGIGTSLPSPLPEWMEMSAVRLERGGS